MKNFLKQYDNRYHLFLYAIIVLGIAVRLITAFLTNALSSPELWEFGVIARNLLSGTGFQYTAISHYVPSAYMPPGLPYIYYFFCILFGENYNGYLSILLLNIIISVLNILILFKLGSSIYGKRIGLLSGLYASLSPVYFYSAITFTPIVYYHLFISICFLYFLKSFYFHSDNKIINVKPDNLKYVILLAVCIGLFLYFRAEMLFLVLAVPLLFLLKKRIKYAAILFFIPLVLISPWTFRNYAVFGKIIPVTTSSGYNFYTGHGDEATTIEYNIILSTFKEDSTFEIKKSELSYQTAFNYIKEKPIEDISESLKRIIDLWVFDRYRDNAKHPVYLITWFLTLILFIFGYYYSIKDAVISSKLLFMKLMLIFSTLLVILYFNIPRYQIQISFIMVPTAMFALNKLIEKLKLKGK